jgi:hypothetical protein
MVGKRPRVQLAHCYCAFETFCLRVITRTADSGQVGGWVMQCVTIHRTTTRETLNMQTNMTWWLVRILGVRDGGEVGEQG